MSDQPDQSVPISPTVPKDPKFTPKLNEALAKAQADFVQPEKNKTVEVKKEGRVLYTTTYADLKNVVEAFRPHIAKHGLSWTQKTVPSQKGWMLVLTLRHESGEYDETAMPVNLEQAPQQVGSQLTYLKRYQAAAYFGIAADDDDDGNGAHGNQATFADKGKKNSQPKQNAKQNAPAEAPKDKPAPKLATAADYVMPEWGGSSKGKALRDIDTPTLEKLRDHLKTKMTSKPKPQNIGEIATAYAHIKSVIVDRTPPPDDQPPANIDPETGEFHPEDETQAFPSDEPSGHPPGPDDFVIPQVEGFDAGDLVGRALIKISEGELRAFVKRLDSEMQKTPPHPKTGELFGVRTAIMSFFKAMDVKL